MDTTPFIIILLVLLLIAAIVDIVSLHKNNKRHHEDSFYPESNTSINSREVARYWPFDLRAARTMGPMSRTIYGTMGPIHVPYARWGGGMSPYVTVEPL